MDPDAVRFVSSCVTYITGRQGANVPEASVGLSVPVPGLTSPNAFCVVLSLPNTMIQDPAMDNEVNVRIEITASLTYGSGFVE